MFYLYLQVIHHSFCFIYQVFVIFMSFEKKSDKNKEIELQKFYRGMTIKLVSVLQALFTFMCREGTLTFSSGLSTLNTDNYSLYTVCLSVGYVL